jgi:hypothetical protein
MLEMVIHFWVGEGAFNLRGKKRNIIFLVFMAVNSLDCDIM